jgi:hypothetical protein
LVRFEDGSVDLFLFEKDGTYRTEPLGKDTMAGLKRYGASYA